MASVSTRTTKAAASGVVRLDGWKLIAAHFGRDRTTVIRWARERGLPVHRLPGGKSGTVYALAAELDRWAGLESQESAINPERREDAAAATIPALRARAASRPQWSRTLKTAMAMLAVGVPSALVLASVNRMPLKGPPPAAALPRSVFSPSLPADPAVARKFLQARDLTADRDALTLERAIALLEQVVIAAPEFAPGQSSLAEALLLSREFGKREDAVTFAQARSAARAAVRLAPKLASGHRMLGFIAYWADGDFDEANAAFAKALALAPDDAFSHLWFGNILSDHGDHAAALKMLDHARLLQPGSLAIQTDLAWAQWSAGEEQVPLAALRDIVRRNPDFAVAHDCLALLAFARGDLPTYVEHFTRYAHLRRNDDLRERARALEIARQRGPDAVGREVARQAVTQVGSEPQRTQIAPALLASVAGDRAKLKQILVDAEQDDERWGRSGFALRIARTWKADRELLGMIERRRQHRG